MEESPRASLPGIAALPPTTARQIGSGQVLVDPSSVVKELIDNALDARAKSIFVDITANTIDTIQVKDDGHGIQAEDRPLVCRRYCTSKIRDLQDLKQVGGKWLGFRGEALSSMAEMSGSIMVITRVEGEAVAVKLRFQHNGELYKIERESHPVGTTVKVTGFFEHMPVRRQTAIKNSSKWLAKIRHLLQAYAFARPAVRFRLRVLKAKNNKSDFVYAPSSNASIEDAALKVTGKDCALQCDWTALEADGFEIHAFLPQPTSNGSKISNYGAFISIDARPVSSLRGTVKRMLAAFKARLRKMSPSLASVKDPFICVNIVCPPDSYDPNIEPAKDDVMFENAEVVLSVFNQLLNTRYPETAMVPENDDPPTSAQQPQLTQAEDLPSRTHTPIQDCTDKFNRLDGVPASDFQEQSRWRSSMYGIDEDDMQFVQEEPSPTIDEENGVRDVEISNPWTIARMNAAVKPRNLVVVNQLLSPAKSRHDESPQSSPKTPHRDSQISPLTPQSLSKVLNSDQLGNRLGRSTTHMMSRSPDGEMGGIYNDREPDSQRYEASHVPPSTTGRLTQSTRCNREDFDMPITENNNNMEIMHLPKPSAPRQNQQRQHVADVNKPFARPAPQSNDIWFGQPMRGSGSQNASRQKRGPKAPKARLFVDGISSSPCRSVLNAADSVMENRLYSEDNTDIRDFFGRGAGPPCGTVPSISFTPINSTSRGSHRELSKGPRDVEEQLRAYVERASPTRASSAGATSMLLDAEDNQTYQQNQPSVLGMRPSSRGSERQSLLPDMPSHPPTAMVRHRNDRQAEERQEMEAHFKVIEAREAPHSDQQPSPVRSNGARMPPPHEKPHTKPHRLRRRTTTTDGLERTKSSRLPLERVPHGHHMQHLLLPMQTTIHHITHSARKPHMMRLNSLKWGYGTDSAFDVFAERASASRVTRWTATLDGVLHAQFGRLSGVDTMCLLHEGVQRAFDAREQRMPHRTYDAELSVSSAMGDRVVRGGTVDDGVVRVDDEHSGGGQAMQGADDAGDLDAEPCVNGGAVSAAQATVERGPRKWDEEFADDIDDDMLLDL